MRPAGFVWRPGTNTHTNTVTNPRGWYGGQLQIQTQVQIQVQVHTNTNTEEYEKGRNLGCWCGIDCQSLFYFVPQEISQPSRIG